MAKDKDFLTEIDKNSCCLYRVLNLIFVCLPRFGLQLKRTGSLFCLWCMVQSVSVVPPVLVPLLKLS
jgi:hypothetical protein